MFVNLHSCLLRKFYSFLLIYYVNQYMIFFRKKRKSRFKKCRGISVSFSIIFLLLHNSNDSRTMIEYTDDVILRSECIIVKNFVENTGRKFYCLDTCFYPFTFSTFLPYSAPLTLFPFLFFFLSLSFFFWVFIPNKVFGSSMSRKFFINL